MSQQNKKSSNKQSKKITPAMMGDLVELGSESISYSIFLYIDGKGVCEEEALAKGNYVTHVQFLIFEPSSHESKIEKAKQDCIRVEKIFKRHHLDTEIVFKEYQEEFPDCPYVYDLLLSIAPPKEFNIFLDTFVRLGKFSLQRTQVRDFYNKVHSFQR